MGAKSAPTHIPYVHMCARVRIRARVYYLLLIPSRTEGIEMSRSWAKGSTRAWRRRRAAVLLANANTNKGRCALDVGRHCPRHGRPCAGVCAGVATQVHHGRGKAAGDVDLVACCAPCNGHVGQPGAVSPDPAPYSRW